MENLIIKKRKRTLRSRTNEEIRIVIVFAICSQLLSAMELNELRSKYKKIEKSQKKGKKNIVRNKLFIPPKKEKKKQTNPEKKANTRR